MSEQDPPRWSSGNDAIARALRVKGTVGPSPEQLERLTSNLGKAPSGFTLPKWAIVVPAVVIVAGAIAIASKRSDAPHQPITVPVPTMSANPPPPVVAATEVPTVEKTAPSPIVPATPRASDIDRELALVKHAEAVLATQPKTALEDTQRLAKDFPDGTYVEEREVVAIDALCHLGRVDEATTRSSAFRARFPGSAYQMRIDRALDAAKDAQ